MHRRVRLVVVVVVVLGSILTVAGIARPAGAVSIVTSPNASSTFDQLSGLSCAGPSSCMAVGSFDSSGVTKTLVESWNGSVWSLVSSPNPTGATDSELSAVSCISTSGCVAVGKYTTSTVTKSLVESWNGSVWSLVASPNPTGASQSVLSGVACASGSSCDAVGASVASSTVTALVERWNGSVWSVVSSPNPIGAAASEFSAVSCRAATSCIAVGQFTTSATTMTLVESWNGSVWSVVPSPNPTGATTSVLTGVSCTSSLSCIAVGGSVSAGTILTLVESWNGSVWSVVPSPNPAGATTSGLSGVSCTGPSSCDAVGNAISSSATNTLVESWNGSAWSVVSSPNPKGATNSQLLAVSCTSVTSCDGVGSTATSGVTKTLVEQLPTWIVATSANVIGATNNQLVAVSCTGVSSCAAVGYVIVSGVVKTLAERWNGTAWSVVSSPNPTSATLSILLGVSCVSSSSCVAVGKFATSTATKTLVESWNGSAWSIVASPNPTTVGFLMSVSCSTGSSCTAVGQSGPTVAKTLIEHWNGSVWSIAASPNPTGANNFLQGVSCVSALSCNAIGYSNFSGHIDTLAERWNGTTWSLVASPNAAINNQLAGISCTSPTMCFADGTAGSSLVSNGLVEQWNGSTWTIVTSPNPSGSSANDLTGVSCTGPSSCTAVGLYAITPVFKTLVEQWNGSVWSIVASPNAGTQGSRLLGVSCVAPAACDTVGYFFPGTTSATKTLAEQLTATG